VELECGDPEVKAEYVLAYTTDCGDGASGLRAAAICEPFELNYPIGLTPCCDESGFNIKITELLVWNSRFPTAGDSARRPKTKDFSMSERVETDIDCETLSGRLRDICRGHDDAGRPVLTPEKCAAYRRRWQQHETAGTTARDGPGLARRAVHFAGAFLRHVRDRRRQVDHQSYQARLAVCRTCPSCDLARMVCREKSCGCRLRVKARWRSESCPLGKWPAVK
jgi:hypothetical protein